MLTKSRWDDLLNNTHLIDYIIKKLKYSHRWPALRSVCCAGEKRIECVDCTSRYSRSSNYFFHLFIQTVSSHFEHVFCSSVTSDLQLPGLPGGCGFGEDSPEAGSPSIRRPKICSSSLASGGGMGKRPMAISTRDRPILQMSD